MMFYNEEAFPGSVLVSRPFNIGQIPHVLAVDLDEINQGFLSLQDDFNDSQGRGTALRPDRQYRLQTSYRAEGPETTEAPAAHWQMPGMDVAIIMATPGELPPEFISEASLKDATQDADGTYDDSFRGKGAIIIDALGQHESAEDLEEQLNVALLRGMIFKQFDAEADRRVKKMHRIFGVSAAAIAGYAAYKLHPSFDEVERDVKIGAISYLSYQILSRIPNDSLQTLLKPIEHLQTGVRLGRKAVMGRTKHFKAEGRHDAAESFFDAESDRLLDAYWPVRVLTVEEAEDLGGVIPESYQRVANRDLRSGIRYSWENNKSARLAIIGGGAGLIVGSLIAGGVFVEQKLTDDSSKSAPKPPELTVSNPLDCSAEALQTLEQTLLTSPIAGPNGTRVGQLTAAETAVAEACSTDVEAAELKTGIPILFRPTESTPHGTTSNGATCYGIGISGETGASYDPHVLSLNGTAPEAHLRAADQTLIICNDSGKTTEVVLTLTPK
jgi:hypothetical protein